MKSILVVLALATPIAGVAAYNMVGSREFQCYESMEWRVNAVDRIELNNALKYGHRDVCDYYVTYEGELMWRDR